MHSLLLFDVLHGYSFFKGQNFTNLSQLIFLSHMQRLLACVDLEIFAVKIFSWLRKLRK